LGNPHRTSKRLSKFWIEALDAGKRSITDRRRPTAR
jgi:hypothetical protein